MPVTQLHAQPMKILFVGGTGNISSSVSRRLLAEGHELWLLNRGLRSAAWPNAHSVLADINQPAAVQAALGQQTFDVVVDWIAFTPEEVQRDIELFKNRTQQYVFISSASVYRKPILDPVLTEATPAHNPFWTYSQNKIACEELLLKAWREQGFPVTIVRPAHTYDQIIPVALSLGSSWTIVDRIRRGLPIVVHGDGTSIWVVTHAEDFAKGFVGLLGNNRAIGETFHITSDELLTWNQISSCSLSRNWREDYSATRSTVSGATTVRSSDGCLAMSQPFRSTKASAERLPGSTQIHRGKQWIRPPTLCTND